MPLIKHYVASIQNNALFYMYTCIYNVVYIHVGTSTDGFTASELAPGDHLLIIRPINVPECRREIGLRVPFQVGGLTPGL